MTEKLPKPRLYFVMPLDQLTALDYLSYLDVVWESKLIKIDWDAYETIVTMILSSNKLTSDEKVALSKETLCAFTKRGIFDGSEFLYT